VAGLGFMSDDAPEQSSKTEDPSQKRLDDAHQKGDVVKSQEVTTWFMLLGSALVFAWMAPATSGAVMEAMKDLMGNADQFEVGGSAFGSFFNGLALAIFGAMAAPLGVLMLFAIVANLVQHRPLLSLEPVKPKLSKISPLAGAKRLFSRDALINFGKGLLKLAVVGAVVFFTVWPERDSLDTMMTTDVLAILANFQQLGIKIFTATLAVVTIIAGADFLYQRQKWWKEHMMTLQETRDEYKQMEGDPKIKGRIRQLRHDRSRSRMMAAVPEATVVITNPTHYAVALKYDRSMAAPVCVAKGADAVALRIKAVAEENKVPVIESPPLARALFASVDVDETIPSEHFKAVAEIIGFVMRLRPKPGWKAE
jgi:flagellar biosynthesis protein FlhB